MFGVMSLKKAKRLRMPFLAQITVILSIGVAVSLSVLFLSHCYKAKIVDENAAEYTVAFAYQDGTVIEKKTVKEGKGVFPPEFETEGVFRGWSSPINNVTADIETHPVIYTINDENLFYFNSVYVKEGKKFTVDLTLAGEVHISSAQLTLEYDNEVMKFIKSSDSEICSVTDNKDGTLTIALDSGTPLTEKTILSQLTFKSKKKDVASSRIDLVCKNGKIVENGKEESATVSTINNQIFYLQGV